MKPRIVDENGDRTAGELDGFFETRFPLVFRGDIEGEDEGAVGKLGGEGGGIVPVGADAEEDVASRVTVEKVPGRGTSECAVGTGNEDPGGRMGGSVWHDGS